MLTYGQRPKTDPTQIQVVLDDHEPPKTPSIPRKKMKIRSTDNSPKFAFGTVHLVKKAGRPIIYRKR